MAKAPRPGTTAQPEPTSAKFTLTDGTEVVCDVRNLTMLERRQAKNELKKLDEADELEALVAALWIVMRRDDPSLDFMDLMGRVTMGELSDAEVVGDEAEVDDPPQ